MTVKTKTTRAAWLALIAPLLLYTGCASSRAAAPTTPTHHDPTILEIAEGAGRIGILQPEVFLYDVSAGGILEFRDDWSKNASRQAARSAAFTLKQMNYSPLIIPDDPNRERDFFRLKTALRYHGTAFRNQFFTDFPPTTFSIGPIEEMCDRYNVDGFLYIYGYEEKFSEERHQFLNTQGEAIPPERTFIALLIAERDGRISWHRHMMIPGNLDMRSEVHSTLVMRALLDW
ncbi:MAG: hypothetical protein LBU70_01510 [Chitinispirillales bacterium]|jgi:hypothetical protein|nr:hypothetical protein [Chitinispirillales bacterium]